MTRVSLSARMALVASTLLGFALLPLTGCDEGGGTAPAAGGAPTTKAVSADPKKPDAKPIKSTGDMSEVIPKK